MPDQDVAGLLASPVRRDVMELLGSLPFVATDAGARTRAQGLTAADLAGRLGLHVTTIRFHLDQLVAAGLLRTRDERGSVGRPKRFYVISSSAQADVMAPEAYRVLAELLADALLAGGPDGQHMTPEAAGERWMRKHAADEIPGPFDPAPAATPGAWLAKIGVVIDLLQRWGYSPSLQTLDGGRTARLDLATCPLRELALSNPTVACGVHAGIVRGAMEVLGESDSEVEILPFVEPRLCVARITKRSVFTQPGGTHS